MSAFLAAGLVLAPGPVSAQQFWDGPNTTSADGVPVGGTGTWNAATTNWTDDAAGTNNQAWGSGVGTFGNIGGTVTIVGPQTITGLNFAVDGYLLQGAGTLELNGTDSQSGTNDLTTIDVSAGTSATISAVINGAGKGLRKNGTGTLTLTEANTYDSDTFINDGTVILGNADALGTGNTLRVGGTLDLGGFTVTKFNGIFQNGTVQNGTFNNNGGLVQVENANISAVLSGAGDVATLGAAATTTFSGANTYTGTTTINLGTLNASHATALGNNSAVTVGATLNLTTDVSAGSLAGAGAVTLNGNTLTTGGDGTSTTFSGVISGAGGGLTKAGAGTFTLSGANTYSGTTTVSAGTLDVTGSIASSIITVDGGGTLQVDGSSVSDFGSVTLNGNGILNLTGDEQIGALSSASGTSSITLGANTLTVNTVGAGSFAGVISGTGQFRKTGVGNQTLSGVNTFSGNITIARGTLTLANANAIDNVDNILLQTGVAVLDLGGNTINLSQLLVNGGVGTDVKNGTVNTSNDKLFFNGEVSAVLGGAGNAIKNGGGNFTLSGNNTYTGTTTVNGGTLLVTATGDINESAAIIITGGTLNVDGGGNAAIGDTVAITNAGTFTLTGSDETIGSIAGAGAINLNDNTLTTGGDGTITTASGVISGAGGLTKIGGGTFRLTGANTYTGTTTVSAGSLYALSEGALGSTTQGDVIVNGGRIHLGYRTHTKQTLLVTAGNVVEGTMNVTGFFGETVGVTATINATGYYVVAPGGTITDLGVTGITATNNTPSGITVSAGATAPAINNTTGDGINFANTGGGNVFVTTGNSVTGANDGISAVSTGNAVVIATGGNVTGTGDAGIELGASATADVNIGAGHTVSGGTTAIRSAAATTTVTNLGTVNNNGATNLIFDVTAGDFTMTNSGTAHGLMQSAGGTTTNFTNANGAEWFINGGTSTMDGNDTITNDGRLTVNGNATLNGVEVFNNTSINSLIVNGVLNLGAATFNNSGRINMQNGVTGDQLNLGGDYVATSGLLDIDTELGGDASPTDLLTISNNTSGATTLNVNNVGGTGAQTTNGIQIVQVNGTSNGTFLLDGLFVTASGEQAILGGAYSYVLQQKSDGSWYLNSSLAPSGSIYETYPQILELFNSVGSFHERTGGRLTRRSVELAPQNSDGTTSASSTYGSSGYDGQRGPFWARIEASHSHFDANGSTTNSDYTTDIAKARFGVDGLYHEGPNGRLFFGLNGWYGSANADISSPIGGGTIDTTGYGVGLSTSWIANNGFYVDAQARFSWFESDLTSNLLGNLASNNDGFGQAWSIEAGIEKDIGDGWTITPQAQLIYSDISFDQFTDPLGTTVTLDDAKRLKGRLGLAVSKHKVWSDAEGDLYGIANLHQEFSDGTGVNVAGLVLDNNNQGDVFGEVGVGFDVNWNEDMYGLFGQAKVGTSLENFGDDYSYSGTIGFKIKF